MDDGFPTQASRGASEASRRPAHAAPCQHRASGPVRRCSNQLAPRAAKRLEIAIPCAGSHPLAPLDGLSRRRSRVRVPSLPYETRPQTAARRAAALERSWNAAAQPAGNRRRVGERKERRARLTTPRGDTQRVPAQDCKLEVTGSIPVRSITKAPLRRGFALRHGRRFRGRCPRCVPESPAECSCRGNFELRRGPKVRRCPTAASDGPVSTSSCGRTTPGSSSAAVGAASC
jgi:hypothetical protein